MDSNTFATIKKPTVRAKQWQLDILKKMHAEEARPSTSQRHKLAVETGLDEAWIRNWFMRKNRVPRPPVQTRPGGPLMRIIKLDPPELNTPSYPDASRPQIPSPHPVVSQGTSTLPPTSESLLASVVRVDEVNSTRRLAPSLSYSVEPRSLGYTSDALPALATSSSSRTSYSFPGKERALRQNTRTWRYSRNPLHNRYPDFSKFFLSAPSDTIGDATKMPEFSPIAMSPLTQSHPSIDAAPSLDFAFSTMQLYPSITTPFLYY